MNSNNTTYKKGISIKFLFCFLMWLVPLIAFSTESHLEFTPIFKAGEDSIHTYRIPSLVSTSNGGLLFFAEGRLFSWKDRSPTVIVFKRSLDRGKTFSKMQILNQDSQYSFTDPCALVDHEKNKIFLFYCAWNRNKHSELNEVLLFYQYSNDLGKTWSIPVEFKQDFSKGRITGLGPGNGLQMKHISFKNRLILPVRLYRDKKSYCTALYSDNGGEKWILGEPASHGGEFQIAETKSALYLNIRGNAIRRESTSIDGGKSWSPCKENKQLATPKKGCQGSVLGVKKGVLYLGPRGIISQNNRFDNRGILQLWHTDEKRKNWLPFLIINKNASGYSCMASLDKDAIAIVLEHGKERSFKREEKRGPEWMNISLVIIDAKQLNK